MGFISVLTSRWISKKIKSVKIKLVGLNSGIYCLSISLTFLGNTTNLLYIFNKTFIQLNTSDSFKLIDLNTQIIMKEYVEFAPSLWYLHLSNFLDNGIITLPSKLNYLNCKLILFLNFGLISKKIFNLQVNSCV